MRNKLMESGTEKRKRAYKRGWHAETIACLYLFLRGHRILARRYKTHAGEIDILSKRGSHIHCIEVKARRTRDEGLYAITPSQQQRIRNTAALFLAQHPRYHHCECHMSAIILAKGAFPHYIRDAF